MENEINIKPRLIITMVVATVVLFIVLVWLIIKYVPWDLLGFQRPTDTASVQVVRDCTYPLTYWKNHPELYPSQIVLGGAVYQERELEALLSDDTQDQAQQLKGQLVVAFLNNQAGADQRSIEAIVFEAYEWLVQHPDGSLVTDDEMNAGRRLYEVLAAYNLGLAGVAPCEAALSITQTSSPTRTVAVEGSQTLTPTSTSTPSRTPTPTERATGTPIPTTPAPSYSSPTFTRTVPPKLTPTHTSPPPATNTPTKQAPTPTETLIPTPTYTPIPPPTTTYTPFPVPTSTYTAIPPY